MIVNKQTTADTSLFDSNRFVLFKPVGEERERGGEREKEGAERERERLTELYFSTVKILAQRPTHIFAVPTVLLITKTFTVKYYDRRL